MKRLILILTLLASSLLHAEEIAIVTSQDAEVTHLEKREVERLFLAKTTRIGGTRVTVVELENAPYKSRFYEKMAGKSTAQLRAYWSRLIFTGKAQPPKQVADMKKLLEKMEQGDPVITYLPLSEVNAGMKVLYTMKE